MSESRKRAKVRVPATSANLGAGFDCLGIALDIWNTVEVQESDEVSIHIDGEGVDELPHDERNVVYHACMYLFEKLGIKAPKLRVDCYNAIPLKRGLGSSAAAIAGGLSAANLLAGEPLGREDLLNLALELEEYPDNVAPSFTGGCAIVLRNDNRWFTRPVPIPPELRAVLFIPKGEIVTGYARAILPQRVSRRDAVHNLGRVALMVNALTSGRLEDLRIATQDRLHQPARTKLFPPMGEIIKAAIEAGALGAFLSGSGPTILALAKENEEAIGRAMEEAGRKSDNPGEMRIVSPSPMGVHEVK